MCGIVGIFDKHSKRKLSKYTDYWKACEQSVAKATEMMHLRGPDGSGMHVCPGAILGHSRLAIIDVDGGQQPLVDPATGVALVFNGEIYNYRELRRQLSASGHAFRTESDTEVLLRAYLQWDSDCLVRLSGIFAFGLYDPRTSALFLARDRVGVKPLFFSCTGDHVMFASSLPALRCFPGVESTLDLATASHYLSTIRTTLGNRTLFRDIHSLQPGEYLLAADGQRPVVRRYWDIPIMAPEDKGSPTIEEAAGRVRELTENAVQEQLVSDVPLGGFLSGGIDSSIIASLACRHTSGNYSAYSIGYARDGYHEWPFVECAAKHQDMACHRITLDEKTYAEDRERLVAVKGSPISTPNEIPIYRLASALRQEFTVALSGEGADEVFGGYTIPYFSAYDYDRARHSAPSQACELSAEDQAMRRLYGRPYLLCRPDHYFLTNSWMPLARKRAVLTGQAWQDLEQDEAMFSYYEDLFRKFEQCSTFDAYMHLHARVNMEGLLARVDSSTMAASVEARVPFTDHQLLEYAFSLPDRHKIDWQDRASERAAAGLNVAEIDSKQLIVSKRVLRKAFSSDIPPAIMKRPKMSFPVPFREWFSGHMRELSRDILLTSPLVGTVLSRRHIEELIRMPERQDYAMALWPLTNLCLWQQLCGVALP